MKAGANDTAGTTSIPPEVGAIADLYDECYQAQALIAGARGILSQLEDEQVTVDAAVRGIDRLLGDAAKRLKGMPGSLDEIVSARVEAANG